MQGEHNQFITFYTYLDTDPDNIIIRRRHLGGARFALLTMNADGELAELEIQFVGVIKGAAPTRTSPVGPPPVPSENVFRRRPKWPIDLLREYDLPLYWNRDWLIYQLINGETLRGLELKYGMPYKELVKFKRIHGIQGSPRHELIRELWTLQGPGGTGEFPTQKALAEYLGLSPSAVHDVLDTSPPGDGQLTRQVRRLLSTGVRSQKVIAARLNISRHKVRRIIKKLAVGGNDSTTRGDSEPGD